MSEAKIRISKIEYVGGMQHGIGAINLYPKVHGDINIRNGQVTSEFEMILSPKEEKLLEDLCSKITERLQEELLK